MRSARRLAVVALLSLLWFTLAASPATRPATTQSAAATQPALQTGAFTIRFTSKSPLSDPVKICRRCGWSLAEFRRQAPDAYTIEDETFSVYVPADYAGAREPYGLFVFVHAGGSGDVPGGGWTEALDRHRLIWIGANNSGNPRPALIRIALAFDAVTGMKAKGYQIDAKRIYIAGASGGAKVASALGICFPDAFSGGGFYFIGADFYRQVLTPNDPKRAYPRGFVAPEGRYLTAARKQSRHVLLTGENDMNREPVTAFAGAFKADGFAHVTLLDVPGLGHRLPDSEWFEKGLEALDGDGGATTKAVGKGAGGNEK
jgi:hypothetical protein